MLLKEINNIKHNKEKSNRHPIVGLLIWIVLLIIIAVFGMQLLELAFDNGILISLLFLILYVYFLIGCIYGIGACIKELTVRTNNTKEEKTEKIKPQNVNLNHNKIIEEPIEITDREDVIEKYGTLLNPKTENYEELHGDVDFNHVEFYYNENEPVLTDFDLHVKQGSMVALVGETGSGKSTIVNLLCRFYEPKNGEIWIDGHNVQDRSIGWLHSNIGYVLQSPTLFSGTILDNIRFGRPDASEEEVIEVAKLIHAHDFIMKMEKGYHSQVGEGGDLLSTGEKQLISFARALLSNPRIVASKSFIPSSAPSKFVCIENKLSSCLNTFSIFLPSGLL